MAKFSEPAVELFQDLPESARAQHLVLVAVQAKVTDSVLWRPAGVRFPDRMDHSVFQAFADPVIEVRDVLPADRTTQ